MRVTDRRLDIPALTRQMGRACAGDFTEKPPMPEEDDAIGRFLAGLRFLIDELEMARQHRDEELERWKQIDRMKTRFINTAAHELGTPLTPILLQVHMLRSLADDEATLRAVDVVERNVGRVARLVDDLLDVAKLENGALPIRPKPVDLAGVVRDVHEGFGGQAEERGIVLDAHVEPALAAVDADRVHQVLQNLVSNALKFTPRGGNVRLHAYRSDGEAHVIVRDDGIGMTGEQLVRLFQPFTQVHDTNPHDVTTGTGLGLYICKGIIEQHGGVIWCDSPGRDQGAAFHIVLPALEQDVTSQEPPATPPSHGLLGGSAARSAG